MTLREDNRRIQLKADKTGERLDAFLVRKLDQSPAFKGMISRSRIQKSINEGLVSVDGLIRKKNYILKGGENIAFEIQLDVPLAVEGENLAFEIIHEDDDIVVVNKPAGIITHPTSIRATGTLINGIIGRGICLAPAGGIFRPGIVHRLDKDTSGAIILAKTDLAYYELVKMFKERSIKKYYSAIVISNLKNLSGSFEQNIGRHPKYRSKMTVMLKGGKEAKTSYKVMERFIGFDFLSLQIYTGRTHQIRVHLSNSGHPILGDKIYAGKNIEQHIRNLGSIGLNSQFIGKLSQDLKAIMSDYPGMFLHAQRLVFKHPVSKVVLEIDATKPTHFIEILSVLRSLTAYNI